jgi:hypothetical protein
MPQTGDLAKLLRRQAESGNLIVACANFGLLDMLLNWFCHLRDISLHHQVVIFALDVRTFRYLDARGFPVHYSGVGGASNNSVTDVLGVDGNRKSDVDDEIERVHGSPQFVRLAHRKTELVLHVLRLGYTVLYSDVDVVWLRDPFSVLCNHSRALRAANRSVPPLLFATDYSPLARAPAYWVIPTSMSSYHVPSSSSAGGRYLSVPSCQVKELFRTTLPVIGVNTSALAYIWRDRLRRQWLCWKPP